ncbi:response regulator transcription factor [Curtobacterium citri]|jgi:DNA-binding NarL/FixJ family response regulator|uniref:Response regulator transcription factor n=1 Tax=Curtobacterium citri TaxID=3055139 RepID=A0ABT7T630_9MICO|nr:response regulator transcription factor [Curtobacterium citri]MDM7885018.1 response regulator transcription factor [Curtobacterium citri]
MTTTPTTSAPIRVALVDDQALFRTGIRMLIDSQPDLRFVGEAGNGAEGVDLVRRVGVDVVLMDVRMPVMDGITATERIVEQGGDAAAKVLVLTTFDFDEAAAKAIRAGASGFVLKDADPEFLLAAVRTVHAGTAVFAASATRELLRRYDDTAGRAVPVPAAFAELTPREREIFDLAARGFSNSEIAQHEYVSEATVKTHISRVLTKLDLRDRVRLVVFAHEHGLVTKAD